MSWIVRLLPVVSLALAPFSAFAVTISGGDWGGADLLPADGDVLSGTFLNVRELRIPAGSTVFVQPGVMLEVHCEDALIDGILDGVGAGDAGGVGGIVPAVGVTNGTSGPGNGAGGGGFGGECTFGGGGGGGGNGNAGGRGAHVYGLVGLGGLTQGFLAGPFSTPADRPRGGGGGGGGSGCPGDGANGGRGGGSVYIWATGSIQMVNGLIDVSGAPGLDALDYGGGGGGGAGGTLVLAAHRLSGTGTVQARGAAGGDSDLTIVAGIAGGGGGGAGGRIKSFAGPLMPYTPVVAGGPAGTNQGVGFNGTNGLPGTTYHEHADLDGDGVLELTDNCSAVPNTNQLDSNFNGVGDACDPCGALPDADADGVCDAADQCPSFDDYDDVDADSVPDGCDVCPDGDDNADADNDTVADACDACPGFDDNVDTDGDTAPDQCDICPGADDFADMDGDLIPDACDSCPAGNFNDDVDGDGVADACDLCPSGDDGLDADGDAIPDACDLCPDNYDPSQTDGDLDGYGAACDCDDNDDDVFPGGVEVCDNDDNDCDGVVDDDPTDGRTWFHDLDGDGDGAPEQTLNACFPPTGFTVDGTDCDDGDPHIRGNGPEVCDGIDNDCDGEVDEVECAIPDPTTDTGVAGTSGCGCSTNPAPTSLAWLGLLGLLGLRRRQP